MNVIIGAGLAGLSAAYHLRSDKYVIFESNAEVGGTCRSISIGDFTFDYAGHVMHFQNDYARGLARKLLDGKLLRHVRKSSIYYDGLLIPYPFQMNLFGLPAKAREQCIAGAIRAYYSRHASAPRDFAEWILRSVGEGIARHFMFPYNEKLWTVHPREMTTAWLDGIVPQPDLKAILDGAFVDQSDSNIGYNAEFWYPSDGGIMEYPRSFARHVKNLRTSAQVDGIIASRRSVSVGTRQYHYSNLISTIPMVTLIGMIQEVPADVVSAAEKLKWNSVYSVLLGIDRADVSDQHWIYFPQEELIFYRIGFPTNLSPNVAPQGVTSISAEVSYRGEMQMSKEELIDRTIQDLRKVELLRDDDSVLLKEAINNPYAYVIFDHIYDSNRQLIRDYLQSHQIYSIGRYGGWHYSSMEDALLCGKEVAERIGVR